MMPDIYTLIASKVIKKKLNVIKTFWAASWRNHLIGNY